MQALGGYYIGHVLKGAHGAYPQFGFVIALLVWLHLGAQMTIFSAEINTVMARKLGAPEFLRRRSRRPIRLRRRRWRRSRSASEAQKIDVEFKA